MRVMILLLALPATHAGEANDSAIFEKILATASSWVADAKPGQKFDSATNDKLAELAKQISDPDLRKKGEHLVRDLERQCLLQVQVRFILSEVARLKGKAITEPIQPTWLLKLVPKDSLRAFTRLTEIDLNEHTDGHAEKKKRPIGEAVDDAWLKNLRGLSLELRRLELSGTAISDGGLAAINNLYFLERLNICLTPVTDACVKHLAGMTRLKRLVICATKVTGSGFEDIPDWPVIESINLHSCPVSDRGLAALSRFGNLQRLEIVHSNVTDTGLAHLAKLKNLRQLHIASHGTTKTGLGFVDGLTNLYQLDVYEQLASNESLARIGKLKGLKMLSLFVGPADDTGLANVRNLTNLEDLNLGGMAKVTDASVDHLLALKNLKQLDVTGTKITPAGLRKLRDGLPSAKIKP